METDLRWICYIVSPLACLALFWLLTDTAETSTTKNLTHYLSALSQLESINLFLRMDDKIKLVKSVCKTVVFYTMYFTYFVLHIVALLLHCS